MVASGVFDYFYFFHWREIKNTKVEIQLLASKIDRFFKSTTN